MQRVLLESYPVSPKYDTIICYWDAFFFYSTRAKQTKTARRRLISSGVGAFKQTNNKRPFGKCILSFSSGKQTTYYERVGSHLSEDISIFDSTSQDILKTSFFGLSNRIICTSNK